jgi:putative ABC transport system permease protein
LIYRLVLENLRHRPVRTTISALLIGGQVAVMLTLVGVSRGTLAGMAARTRGTGADIIVRPPDSSVFGFGSNMPEALVGAVRELEHVTQATGVLVHPIGGFDSITGIDVEEFSRMSGGLVFLEGGPFAAPEDIVVDRVFARQRQLHPGDSLNFGHQWRVTGVVEEGKLSRTFADIAAIQDIFAENGKISMVYVKLDDPVNAGAVVDALEERLPTYKVYPMEEFVSLFTVSGAPLLEGFTRVVIGVAALGGFLVVLQSMYMAVLERTREIGILKAMGASPGYIMGILLREAVVLALAGTVLGILMTYGTRELMALFAPNFPQAIVPDWYPWAALIALAGALIGALYPGLKAARQDAIEALAYD